MANATYYATCYQADQPAPACTAPGTFRQIRGSLAFTAALATTDTLYLARIPANHRVTKMVFQFAEIDSGTTVTVNIGTAASGTTYDDADAYTAASTLFRAASVLTFPTSGTTSTGNPSTWLTGPAAAGTPNVDYDVVMVLAAGPSTATSGTIRFWIEYTTDATLYDATSSPAAVAGTQ